MTGIGMPHFISQRLVRVFKWIFFAALIIIILLLIGNRILSSYIIREVQTKFEEAGGNIGELDVNLFTQSITVHDVQFIDRIDSDTVVATTAHIKTIAFDNISIYQLVANKDLVIDNALIANGKIVLNRAQDPEDTIKTSKEDPLRRLYIENLKLEYLSVVVVNDSLKEYSGTLNANILGLKSPDTASIADLDAYTIEDIEFQINSVVLSAPEHYYIEIAKVDGSSIDSTLVVDSLRLVPKYTKFNFAQVAGKQTDRINTFIGKLEIEGLQYCDFRHSAVVASKVKIISGEVHSFRDKRQPFRETRVKPLPIAALRSINFGIEIDTIEIKDSKIAYEEFAPKGFDAGTVFFEELNATLTNLNTRNDNVKPDHATLSASAKLMGQGLIEATFELPYRDGEPYLAKGRIGKMSLDYLNPPLQNLAFIRIESGTLEGLVFNFSYNDKVSTGKVTINYQDLKIEGLRKEKSAVINDLKTLLINTIIKNDKDKDVPVEKRTGTVDFERDRLRQIFNYWWKSLFSGIKSSVMDD